METLETLKRRMDTAEALCDLVRTMKALSAVSVRHYEHAVAALADYDRAVQLGLRALLRRAPPPPVRRGQPGCSGVLVIGSDQGLCGTFNEQVVRRVLEDLDAEMLSTGRVRLFAVGARVAARLDDAGLRPQGEAALPATAALLPALVQDLLLRIDGWRAQGGLDRVTLYYNRPIDSTGCRPHRQTLVPVTDEWLRELAREPWPTRMLPQHTAEHAVLLGALTRQHLFVGLHRALAWSLAGEHASRMLAMQAAERNIEERVEGLRARYHSWRQTAITTELLDIVAGVEALPDDSPSGRTAAA